MPPITFRTEHPNHLVVGRDAAVTTDGAGSVEFHIHPKGGVDPDRNERWWLSATEAQALAHALILAADTARREEETGVSRS